MGLYFPEMKPLSQKEQKLVRALASKKYRDEYGLFVAEGSKVIEPLMPFFELRLLLTSALVRGIDEEKQRLVPGDLFAKLSGLTTPTDRIALFRLPDETVRKFPRGRLTVALDVVQNPGNLGTIIRLCDWLGIRTIILGSGTADPFAPKVVQATAGALGNVDLIRTGNLLETLKESSFDEVIGTSLSGTPLSAFSETREGDKCVLFGNEGHGLSPALQEACTRLVLIPPAPTAVSESLNVSISAAILLSRLA